MSSPDLPSAHLVAALQLYEERLSELQAHIGLVGRALSLFNGAVNESESIPAMWAHWWRAQQEEVMTDQASLQEWLALHPEPSSRLRDQPQWAELQPLLHQLLSDEPEAGEVVLGVRGQLVCFTRKLCSVAEVSTAQHERILQRVELLPALHLIEDEYRMPAVLVNIIAQYASVDFEPPHPYVSIFAASVSSGTAAAESTQVAQTPAQPATQPSTAAAVAVASAPIPSPSAAESTHAPSSGSAVGGHTREQPPS